MITYMYVYVLFYSYVALSKTLSLDILYDMNWSGKMRRAWIAVLTRFRPHKSPGDRGGRTRRSSSSGGGLLKLQDDVEMCGYEDVRIMWDILSNNDNNNYQTTSDCQLTVKPKLHEAASSSCALSVFFGRSCMDPLSQPLPFLQ